MGSFLMPESFCSSIPKGQVIPKKSLAYLHALCWNGGRISPLRAWEPGQLSISSSYGHSAMPQYFARPSGSLAAERYTRTRRNSLYSLLHATSEGEGEVESEQETPGSDKPSDIQPISALNEGLEDLHVSDVGPVEEGWGLKPFLESIPGLNIQESNEAFAKLAAFDRLDREELFYSMSAEMLGRMGINDPVVQMAILAALAKRGSPSAEREAQQVFAAGAPCFIEGGTVIFPFQPFVHCQSDEQLATALENGVWTLLTGHRQSGKSSTVAAAMRLLRQNRSITVYHITLADPIEDQSALWSSIHMRLHSLDSKRFPLPKPNSAGEVVCTADTFLDLFTPDASASPEAATAKTETCLVIDETSVLASMKGIESFLSHLRVCRDQRTHGWLLKSMVLVGTPIVKALVADVDPSKNVKRRYSPFTVDASLEPQPFTQSQIRQLLEQFCQRKLVQLLPSPDDFAADIYGLTQGHRGLSVVCCAEVEKLVGTSNGLQLEQWKRHAASQLIPAVATRSTYQRIMLDLYQLQPLELDLLEQVLLRGGCYVRLLHPAVQTLLDDGFIKAVPIISAGGVLKSAGRGPSDAGVESDSLVVVAAPLLAGLLFSHLSTTIDPSNLQKRPADDRAVGRWLLESALQHVEHRMLSAPEVQLQERKRRGQASEYTWQALFMITGRGVLLSQSDLPPRWLLLPEVRVSGDTDANLRLDFLLRNGVGPFGFEFLIRGDQKDLDEHIQRCFKYAELHKAHVYAINVMLPTPSGRRPKAPKLPPANDKVTAMNVYYDEKKNIIHLWSKSLQGQDHYKTLPLDGPRPGRQLVLPKHLHA